MSKNLDFPKYKRKSVIDALLKDPMFIQRLDAYADQIQASKEELYEKARNIFEEMAAQYQPAGFWLSRMTLKVLLSFFFKKLKVYGDISKLKETSDTYIFLPSHRSHFDYLFLSYILFQNKIAPPHIAAGINLSFFPMGYVFRRLGAFFIRRKISGNVLYVLCLKTYLRWLLNLPASLELFVEGGRSRDGTICKPQTGILTLVIEALQSMPNTNIQIVPVSITYDFTPDVPSFMREARGQKKEKESFFSLLRSALKLENYQNIHFNFLPPVSTSEILSENPINKKHVQRFADNILEDIQSQTVVTPFQIVASALTCLQQPIFEDELYQACLHIIQHLKSYHVTLSSDVHHFESRFLEITDQLIQKKWLRQEPGYMYRLTKDCLPHLNYYRASIAHFFGPILFATCSAQDHPIMTGLQEHAFQVLGPKYKSNNLHEPGSGILQAVAYAILKPYAQVLDRIDRSSVEHIQEMLLKPSSPKDFPVSIAQTQRIHTYLSKKAPDEIRRIEDMLKKTLCINGIES